MKWELFCHILKDFGVVRTRRQGFNRATKVLLLDESAADLPGVAYVTDGKASPTGFRYSLIISAGACAIHTENLIELEPVSVVAVVNAIMEAACHLHTLDETLSRLDTAQELLDAAGMCLNRPITCFDEAYRIIAITRHVAFEYDDEWRHMTEKGYLSPQSTMRMVENGDMDMLAAVNGPVAYRSEIFPYKSIVMNVLHEGCYACRINMICTDGDDSPMSLRECEIIAEHIRLCLLRAGRPLSGDPLRSVLNDLLQGSEPGEAMLLERLHARPEWSAGVFRVFFIDPGAKQDRQVAEYYIALLGVAFAGEDVSSLSFGDGLVLVAHGESAEALARTERKLADFVLTQRLKAGASNVFTRLSRLRGHFGQALFASGRDEGLSFYHDHMLDRMLSYIPSDNVEFLISPDLKLLAEADIARGAALNETLREYLACGCGLIPTAERLFIHKNTLLYRLARIKSIIKADLSDPDERLLLTLSYKLSEHSPPTE